MAFDWKAYLELAKFLQQPGTSYSQEAASRSAVSRAYYAAYCHARNYARDREKFIPEKSSEDHRRVRQHHNNHKRPDIALNLDQLRQWRNKCDYDDEVHNIPRLLTSAIEQAQKVLAALE